MAVKADAPSLEAAAEYLSSATAQTPSAQSPVHTAGPDPTTYTVTLLFDQENGVPLEQPKQHPIVVTPALARVFVRAAALIQTQEPPLQFSTLLIAMLVDEDDWLKRHCEAQQVRFDAIASRRSYNELSLRSLTESMLQNDYLTSMSARAALDEAERIARLTSGSTVDTRHLVAAYPVLANWHLSDFAAFDIDRLEWARTFGAEMARRFPTERPYWRAYADRAAPVPLTSFSADVYTEQDLLGIDRTVDALALLIASTRTVTPLAIGVFGPWGSGKTFFMRHLQKRIVAIRRDEQAHIKEWIGKRANGTAKPGDAPLYFGEIAQVEFNAWHYNEGNLVASLVEHLLRNLRVAPGEGDEELARRRAEMLKQLKVLNSDLTTVDETIAAAKKNVDAAKAGVEQASRDAEAARKEVAERAQEIDAKNAALHAECSKLDATLKAIDLTPKQIDPEAVIAVALGPLAPLAAEVRKAITDAQDRYLDWREFFARVFTAKGLVVVALCAAAPAVLALAHKLEVQWAAFTASVMAALAGFGNAFDVLKHQRSQFEAKLGELEAEQQRRVNQARQRIETQRADLARRAQAEITVLAAALDTLRKTLAARESELSLAAEQLARRARDHDAQLAERVKAERRVRAAEAELERLSSALLLEEFIKDRASTDEYRKQLGFLALVRRDIERLSKLIDDANQRWLAANNRDAPPLLNRIVLYIDDLDRCKESTVLAVLEAVHLLLAFPLFVCAVAVDPRWVEKCLREAHKQLFVEEDIATRAQPNAAATVGDYLEKIFQIPIWMSPIESRTRATLVNSLLGPTAAPVPRGARADTGTSAVIETADTERPGAFTALVAKARERPDPLRISPEEASFVQEIGALLSDRPRALKRFVNIYRLLKASLPDIERSAFVTAAPSSPHRICLSQLAFFTSHPQFASTLVTGLEQSRDESGANGGMVLSSAPSLADWFKGPHGSGVQVRAAFEVIPGFETLPLEEFRRWLPLTSRYLFHRAD